MVRIFDCHGISVPAASLCFITVGFFPSSINIPRGRWLSNLEELKKGHEGRVACPVMMEDRTIISTGKDKEPECMGTRSVPSRLLSFGHRF